MVSPLPASRVPQNGNPWSKLMKIGQDKKKETIEKVVGGGPGGGVILNH